jgi:hypothetical protein
MSSVRKYTTDDTLNDFDNPEAVLREFEREDAASLFDGFELPLDDFYYDESTHLNG